ncbi:MAG: ABC transporter transmembrane domain-containing protein [Nitrospirota bacterium]|nr:ABC transporter transmembrane domain-containing protein [Nitrospirota bacterium]
MSPSSTKQDFFKLLNYVKPYKLRLLGALLCMVVVGGLTSASAFIVKPAFDNIFLNRDAFMLKLIPLLIVGIFAFKGVFFYFNQYLTGYVGHKIMMDMRSDLITKLLSLSASFFQRDQSGVMISRVTNDVNLLKDTVSVVLTRIVKDSFTVVGLLFVALYRDPMLSLISFTVFPAFVFPIVQFGRRLKRVSHQSQHTIGEITSFLQEMLLSYPVIAAFRLEEVQKARFKQKNERLFKLALKQIRISGISTPIVEVVAATGIAFTVAYGGYVVFKGESTPGNFFSFIAAVAMMYDPFKKLSDVNNVIQQGLAAANRIFSVLDEKPDIQDAPGAAALETFQDGIELENVWFSYQGPEGPFALRGVSLAIPKGAVTAIVGESGAGKSSLISLLLRFWDPTKGRILLDGHDLRSITLASLRDKFAIVTQHTMLFDDTIINNIRYGRLGASDEEIERAAKAAFAHEFIQKLPGGYQTNLGELGMKLSGGQRQRIAIARALLKDAPILILDEAMSSLDAESEHSIQLAMKNLMAGRTTIVIAHRLSTVKNAKAIVVMEQGRIIEMGNHESLLAKEERYARLFKLQLLGT